MPFDEDLRRQFEALTDRIRAEVTRQLAISTDELTASAEAERVAAVLQATAEARAAAVQESSVHLSSAVADAEERGRTEGREAGLQDGLAQGRLEGRQEGLAEGREKGRNDALAEARASELAAGQRLIEAVRAIDRAPSLSEILDTLAGWAGREAARVGVWLVRGDQLRGWRFIGFDAALDEAGGFEMALDEGGVIADAVRGGEPASANSSQGSSIPTFATVPPGLEMLAVPITVNGHVVAVLYADQAGDESSRSGQPEVAWPTVLEVLARHAARCLETVTAFRAAQVVTERAQPSARITASGGAIVSGSGDSMNAANEPGAGEEDEAARRYARLLISEIRLYHEPEVIAGRRDRDVAVRLGGQIARARGLYEQRVPARVRAAADHFHAELVRTLADGDPSLLGQAT